MGCVLLQKQEYGSSCAAGYWYRPLKYKNQKLDKTRMECLEVLWSVTFWWSYLEEACFKIRMDHEAFRGILTVAEATGKLARWYLRLSNFEFDIVYRAKVGHEEASALSRAKAEGEEKIKTERRGSGPHRIAGNICLLATDGNTRFGIHGRILSSIHSIY